MTAHLLLAACALVAGYAATVAARRRVRRVSAPATGVLRVELVLAEAERIVALPTEGI